MMNPTNPYGSDEYWTVESVSPTTVHVLPVNDLVEHVLDADCVCGPETEVVFRDDGSTGWVVTHPGLDERL